MQTLSKEAEEKIVAAAKQAVDLVDERGFTPDAAVEKLARENGFNADTVRFLSYAYNTGRQTAQREGADSVLGKFADFPLVDAERVITSLYPPKAHVVKAAAAAALAVGVPDYEMPPGWLYQREAQAERVLSKQAQAVNTEKTAAQKAAAAKRPVTMKEAYDRHLKLKRDAEACRSAAGRAYDAMLGGIGKLAEYFTRLPIDREPFYKVAYVVDTYYGVQGRALMDWVAERNQQQRREPQPPTTEKTARDAWAEHYDRRVIRFDQAAEPYTTIRHCLKLSSDVLQARRAETKAAEALELHAIEELAPFIAQPKIIKRAADSLIPEPDIAYYDAESVRAFLPHRLRQVTQVKQAAAAAPPKEWSILDGLDKTAGNVANWATGTAVGMGTRGLIERATGTGGSASGDKAHDAYVDLEDPAHDSRLRQIRSQATLTELMNDDDAIAGHDPDDVMRAYNEISQMAPRVADQPIALRTLMRHQLQANMEPHEAQQITQMESGLMGTRSPVPQHMEPLPRPPKPPAPSPTKMGSDPYRIMPDEPVANDSILTGVC